MKKVLFVLAIALLAAPAMADYYLAGDFNGWTASGVLMTDLGGGIWQADLAGIDVGRHQFKVTTGDWSQNWPGSGNSWFYTDASGNATITFNANDVQDGWRGNWGRIGVSVDPGAWTAVGDWQGWNNADAATAMVAKGGGIYQTQATLAPGWYQWKAVNTGTWDSIGDDFRSINASTTWFEITAERSTAVFTVDALAGIIKVDTVPEPSGLLALVTGLPLLAIFRKRH